MDSTSQPRRSSERLKTNSNKTSTASSLPNTTNTFQIRELTSHRGDRNLVVKEFAGSKRPASAELRDENVQKKQKMAQIQAPPAVTSTSGSQHQPQSPITATSISLRIQPQPNDHFARVPTTTLIQVQVQSSPSPIQRLAATSSQRYYSGTPAWITQVLQPQFDIPVILASYPNDSTSRMLPNLPGLDPNINVDFDRSYGADNNHAHTEVHSMLSKAIFGTKTLQYSALTLDRLPGSATVIEPLAFYSPIKELFDENTRIASLKSGNQWLYLRPWTPPENNMNSIGLQIPKRINIKEVISDCSTTRLSNSTGTPRTLRISSPMKTHVSKFRDSIAIPTPILPSPVNTPTSRFSSQMRTLKQSIGSKNSLKC